MEFIITGDFQFSNNISKSYIRPDGCSSWLYTQTEVLCQIFDYAEEHNVKYIIHNGDLFEDKNKINVNLYNIVWESFHKYSKDFLYIIFNTGNHDYMTVGRESSLKPFSDIVTVIDKPTKIDDVYIIPHEMVRMLDTYEAEECSILITHEEIVGLKMGPLDYESKNGVPPEKFEGWDVVFNSHIHKPQEFGNIINVGSPLINTWGEAGEVKRFIHYKEGTVNFIPTDCPSFYNIPRLSDKLVSKIDKDNYNFYRIDVTSDEITNSIFNKYNVVANVVKTKKREIRIREDLDPKEELESYIDTQNIGNLDKDKLIKIGLEVQSVS